MESGNSPNHKRKRDDVDDAVALLNGRPFDTTMMAHPEVYHISNLNRPNASTTLTSNEQSASTRPTTPPDFIMDPSMRVDGGDMLMGRSPGDMVSSGRADYMTQVQELPVYRAAKRQFRRPLIQTPAEQEEEGRILRLKNKEAAQRCREKKKQQQQEFVKELVRLRQENYQLMEACRQARASVDQMHTLLGVHEQCDHPEMRDHFSARRSTAIQQSQEAYAQLYQNQTIGYPQDVYNSPTSMHPHGLSPNGYAVSQPVQQPMMNGGGNQIPTPSVEAITSDSGIGMSRDENSSSQTRNGSADPPIVSGPPTERQAPSNPDAAPGVVDGASSGLSEDADGEFEFFD